MTIKNDIMIIVYYMEVVCIKTISFSTEYEAYLDSDVFITQEELTNDYGIRLPHKNIQTLYVKDKKIFNTFKESNLVTLNTQTGKTTMSETLLLDLIRNPGMFKYLINNLFNPSAVVVEIRLFDDGKIDYDNVIRLKRIDVLTFYQEYDKKDLSPTEKMRIALLLSTSHRETLEKVYNNEILVREIDGQKYTYNVNWLIDTIFLPEDQYQDFIKHGENKEIIALLIVEFFELNRIFEKYLLPVFVLNRLERLKSYEDVDYESLNKCLNTNDEDEQGISIMEQFELNPELHDYLFQDIPSSLSRLEVALLLYIKLCEVLTYDEEYYANAHNTKTRQQHENISEIESITIENNKVINYEFILIYAKLLSELGISYTLSSGFGSEQGPLLKFRYNEYLMSINAIEITINNDLANAKFNKPLTGLTSINESKISSTKFNELFTKIQKEYHEQKESRRIFAEALEEYNNLFMNTHIDPIDKITFLIEAIQKQKLGSIEALEYINCIYHQILGSDFKINFISEKRDGYRPLVLLSNEESNSYYLINLYPEPGAITISPETLESKFESGEFAYTNRQDRIPGIHLPGGRNYVRRS